MPARFAACSIAPTRRRTESSRWPWGMRSREASVAAAIALLAVVLAAGAVAVAVGAALGAVNGALVANGRLPSIVVTLATMVALRDALRWTTEGAWVQGLPADFQWLGLGQRAYPLAALAIA